MDDLAFDMYVDTEVAQILRKLEAKKRDAIAGERILRKLYLRVRLPPMGLFNYNLTHSLSCYKLSQSRK